jgi:hypothetical protein
MIRALILGDRAYCGRPGCGATALGVLEYVGSTGHVLNLSRRWLWDETLSPARWRRAPNVRTRVRTIPSLGDAAHREPGRWVKDAPWPGLPTIVECPTCHGVNEVVETTRKPETDGVDSQVT